MTETDAVLGDDGLRLLDVLLEEEALASAVARPAAIAARPRHWLRAIAALLGIAVVVATSWFAVLTQAPTPADSPQDPEPARRAVPFDPALLPRVVAVRVGLRRIVGATGAVFVYPLHQQRHITYSLQEVVERWRTAIATCEPDDQGRVCLFTIDLHLDDGSMITGLADDQGALRFEDRAFADHADLRALMQTAIVDLDREYRRAAGIATSLEELRTLPPTTRAIVCPWLTGDEARRELVRFPDLESIEFTSGHLRGSRILIETRSLLGNDLALALAEIPTLRDISVLAGHLHADSLRALVQMPRLRSLSIGSGPESVPAAELGELAHRLEELRAPHGQLTDEQLRAIRRAPKLRELWLRADRPTQELAECLRSLPRLRRLSVAGNSERDVTDLMSAIASTKIDELQLTWLVVETAGLAPLAELPTLHTLVLSNVLTPQREYPDLVPLRQLRHLQVANEANLLRAAREALPACDVHTNSPADPWTSPFKPRVH